MRVIYKSLLDLIPLTLVAIAISYIAGYTLREISTSYRQIISEDVSVISELRIANNALDSWKALVSEGISYANDTSDGGYTFFEKTEEEEKLFAQAISEAMLIYAPDETSKENPESSEIKPEEEIVPSETETEKRELFLILQTLYSKISSLSDKTDEIKYSTTASTINNTKVIEDLNAVSSKAVELADEGIRLANKVYQNGLLFKRSSTVKKEDALVFDNTPIKFQMLLIDLSSNLKELKNDQIKLEAYFGRYLDQAEEIKKQNNLLTKVQKTLNASKNTALQLIAAENTFKDKYAADTNVGAQFDIYISKFFASSIEKSIFEYERKLGAFKKALVEDGTRLRKLKLQKTMTFSEFRNASDTIGRILKQLEIGIEDKTANNDFLTEQRILSTWVLSGGGIFIALLIGYLVARRTILFPMNEFTRVTKSIANNGDFSLRLKTKGNDEISAAG